MAILVDVDQAKSDLSQLIAQTLAGEEVVITRDGVPVARLVPIRRERVPGLAPEKVRIGPDFDEPLPEEVLREFEAK